MIAFPPCTYLFERPSLEYPPARTRLQTEEALIFVRTLMDAPIPRIAIENPVGCISSRSGSRIRSSSRSCSDTQKAKPPASGSRTSRR